MSRYLNEKFGYTDLADIAAQHQPQPQAWQPTLQTTPIDYPGQDTEQNLSNILYSAGWKGPNQRSLLADFLIGSVLGILTEMIWQSMKARKARTGQYTSPAFRKLALVAAVAAMIAIPSLHGLAGMIAIFAVTAYGIGYLSRRRAGRSDG